MRGDRENILLKNKKKTSACFLEQLRFRFLISSFIIVLIDKE